MVLFKEMRVLLASLALLLLHDTVASSSSCKKDPTSGVDLWSSLCRIANFLVDKCLWAVNKQRRESLGLRECLKRKSLLALDRALSRDVIKIGEGLVLARRKNDSDLEVGPRNRNLIQRNQQTSFAQDMDWAPAFLQRILLFLRTRVLKLRLNGFSLSNNNEVSATPRHRKKGGMMGNLMMFGMVAAGLIVIPMGFQFLAVLGGKALLLAKLALLLTSIQGLKKIATSHVNYGLYSTDHDHHWHYDRQWPYESDNYYPSHAYTALDASHSDVSSQVHLQPRQEEFHYRNH